MSKKSYGWKFDWKAEIKEADRMMYKLTIVGNLAIIQGLLSVSDYSSVKNQTN